MRISYWSSDVCSSDLPRRDRLLDPRKGVVRSRGEILDCRDACQTEALSCPPRLFQGLGKIALGIPSGQPSIDLADREGHARIGSNERADDDERSEEHTSELQSLMRISYAVFCLKKKKKKQRKHTNNNKK